MLSPDYMTSSLRSPSASPRVEVAGDSLLGLAQHLREEVAHVVLSKHQAALVVKRFRLMCINLSQLPNSRPTPSQLSVAASVAELLAQLADETLYAPLLLRQSFTCVSKFAAVSSRLKAVWRLQSTADWAIEDRAASAEDEKAAAAELLRRFASHEPSDEAAVSRTLSAMWFPEHAVGSFSHASGEPQSQPRSAVEPFSCDSSDDAGATRTGTVDDVLDWVRRRQLGTWRLPFESLHRERVEREGDAHACTPRTAGSAEAHTNGVRHGLHFTFDDGSGNGAPDKTRWFFGNCPVVLQTLRNDVYDDASAASLGFDEVDVAKAALADAQSLSLMDFVQDATARVSWCHPHLLHYWGAYSERLPSTGTGGSDEDGEGEFSSTHSSRRGATPELCLAMVLADPQQPPALAESPDADARITTASLSDVLFTQRRVLTVEACVQIVEQVADALQYILLDDIDDTPDAVLTAWCTISPSNLFVRECWVPQAGEAGNAAVGAEITRVEQAIHDGSGDGEDAVFVTERHSSPASNEESRGSGGVAGMMLHSRLTRYAPPCAVTGIFAEHSRWKPHPQAACPPCYALSQLLLALLTRCPPYRRFRTQAELRDRVFDVPENDDDLLAEGLPAVKTSRPRGYGLPSTLPAPLKALCVSGLRLESSREKTGVPHRHRIVSAQQQLQQWREQLTTVRQSMSWQEWVSPLSLAGDPAYGRTGLPATSPATTEVPMKTYRGMTAQDDYAADWFEYGLPDHDDEGNVNL